MPAPVLAGGGRRVQGIHLAPLERVGVEQRPLRVPGLRDGEAGQQQGMADEQHGVPSAAPTQRRPSHRPRTGARRA